MKDRTIVALVVLIGCFGLEGICIWGLIQGADGLIVGIFSGIAQVVTAVVTWYFGGKSTSGGGDR